MIWPLMVAATVAPPNCYSYADPSVNLQDSRPPKLRQGSDLLGDAWEMEEVACWKATGLRRGQSNLFDGYWDHPTGERVRAVVQAWVNGRHVTLARWHAGGKYCRYDGLIGTDGRHIEGRYACTWEKTPMRWTAEIIRLSERTPHLLRDERAPLPLPPR